MNEVSHTRPYDYLGFGLGLRTKHYYDVINKSPDIDWFEILTENYLIPGGKPFYFLDKIAEQYPIVMHGVSLSIGSQDPINWDYLRQVKQLANRVGAKWISDHCCWTGINNKNMHDLLPMPYTHEAILHLSRRIRQVQDYLERQILIENVSSYLTYQADEMTEWDFLRTLAEESNCLFLLDINNIYVSSYNHGFDPIKYLDGIPANRVQQFHLAGHTNKGDYIIDTHDHPVIDPVWKLYAEALNRFGKVSTMIERDDHIPPLAELMQELNHAKHIASDVFNP